MGKGIYPLASKNSYLNTDKQAKKWEVLAYNIGNSKSVLPVQEDHFLRIDNPVWD